MVNGDILSVLLVLLIVIGTVAKQAAQKKFDRMPHFARSVLREKMYTPKTPMLKRVQRLTEAEEDLSQPGRGNSLRETSFFLEDRSNDWLAKQLREERKILLRGDLADLGARHFAECDARAIKEEHLLEHDDSIDCGEF